MDELDVDAWQRISARRRKALALQLARRASVPLELIGVFRNRAGRSIARFASATSRFVFVPGTKRVELGYEPNTVPLTKADRAYLRATYEPNVAGFEASTREMCSVPRSARIPPMLVEESLNRVGLRRLDDDDPRIADLAEVPVGGQAYSSHGAFRVDEEGGRRFVEEMLRLTHAEVQGEIAPFRLATEDEWEWCCGAGSRSFFRWGDYFPVREQPPGINARPRDGWPVFAPAAARSALGLCIANDPYDRELCATLGVYRGGDGGESWCGGEGTLRIWRTLSTWFRWKPPPPRHFRNPFAPDAPPPVVEPPERHKETAPHVRRVLDVRSLL